MPQTLIYMPLTLWGVERLACQLGHGRRDALFATMLDPDRCTCSSPQRPSRVRRQCSPSER
jgi:hypothetical protein